jgi:hypothetical protein
VKIPRVKRPKTNFRVIFSTLQREKKLKGRRIVEGVRGVVDVTCAVVASQVVAKNVVTQGQSEDERFATADGDFSRPAAKARRVFRLRPTPKKKEKRFSCVYLLFIVFNFIARAAAKRKKKNKQRREGKLGKSRVKAEGILCAWRESQREISCFAQNVFLSQKRSFRGEH